MYLRISKRKRNWMGDIVKFSIYGVSTLFLNTYKIGTFQLPDHTDPKNPGELDLFKQSL